MQKIYNLLKTLTVVFSIAAVDLNAQTYCASNSGTTYDEEIYNVMLNGNVTNPLYSFANGCVTPAPGPGSALSMYSNFTSLGSFANLIVGSVGTFSIAENECDGATYWSNGCAVWIDYNQNGLFTDPGETIYLELTTTMSPRSMIGTFTVPLTATFGPTRMRVIVAEGYSGPSLTPCITGYGYGETEDYLVTIMPSTPCSTAPAANSILPTTFTTCPFLANPNLNLTTTYTTGGITYQWQSSTVSPVGPFTSVPGATLNSVPLPTLGVTTWYQAVVTCTNTGGNITVPSAQVFVSGPTQNTVPYYENFDLIQVNNRLPNCSWYAANIGSSVQTYTSSQSNNRVPRSGNNFGSFGLPSTNNLVYSNGITMSPGITYSAAIYYATEYFGYNNWTNLSLWVGTSQSPASLVQIAQVGPAVSGAYKLLSGTFTIPSPGTYYIAIKATAANGSALYLSFDDLSVTIPCYGAGAANSPTMTLSANQTTICTGDAVALTASGADTYTWSTGSNSNLLSDVPFTNTTYTVLGSNALTGCTSKLTQFITVNPSPNVMIFANTPSVCAGQPAVLTALGASSYVWSNGSSNSVITVSPTSSANYVVIGTSNNGCTGTTSKAIAVSALPIVSANSSNQDACKGDLITLSGVGGLNYTWVSGATGVVSQGSPINVILSSSTVYTLTGTSAVGCAGKATLTQNINNCVGINKYSSSVSGVSIYPNPSNGEFTIESNSGLVKTIDVLDLTGRVVVSTSNAEEFTQINIASLSNGIYFVRIKSDNKLEVIKVVKQ